MKQATRDGYEADDGVFFVSSEEKIDKFVRGNFMASNFMKQMDKNILEAGDRFIRRIKTGVLHKRTLPNCYIDYPLDEASDSFDTFLKSDV